MKSETARIPGPVCLLRGGQTLIADRFVGEVSKRFLEEPDAAGGVSVFYADETPAAEVIGGIRNLSMFSSKKIVVLKRAETLDKQSVELVKQYAASPSSHVCFILISGDVSKPDLKSAKGVFVKNIEEDSKKIPERVVAEAQNLGIAMQHAAATYLCELVGEDLNVIRSELAKIAEIQGTGAQITRDDIARMLERRKSRDVFELTNAIMDARKTEALVILGEIAAQNQIEPLLILSAVSSRMRNVLRAAVVRSKSSGASPEQQKKQIAKELKIKPGAAHFIWKQSHNFTRDNAAGIIKTLADADRALKTSKLGGYETLAKMTVSLLAKRRKRREGSVPGERAPKKK